MCMWPRPQPLFSNSNLPDWNSTLDWNYHFWVQNFQFSSSGRQGHVHKTPSFSVSLVLSLSYCYCPALYHSLALVTCRKTTASLYMPCRYRIKKDLIIFLAFRSATLRFWHQHLSAQLEFARLMIDADQLHFHFVAFFQHTFHTLETLM